MMLDELPQVAPRANWLTSPLSIAPSLEVARKSIALLRVAGERRLSLWATVIVIAAFAVTALLSHRAPEMTMDSPVYVEMAKHLFERETPLVPTTPIHSGNWFDGMRPVLVPLALRLSGSVAGFVALQSFVSLVSWVTLGLAAASLSKTLWLRPVAVFCICSFAASPVISGHNSALMSESLSFSAMALFLASWLWLARSQVAFPVAAVALTGFLWVLTRDTGAYILASLLPVLGAVALCKRRMWPVALMACFALTAVFSLKSADAGRRWEFPFVNTLFQRVLTDKEATAYFADQGMTVTGSVLAMGGKWAASEDWAYYVKPELAPLREWVRASGKSTYMHYLATHPRLWLPPRSEWRIAVQPVNYGGFTRWYPDNADFLWLVGLGLLALGVAPATYRGILAGCFGLSVIFIVLCYQGDAMDLERHALAAGIMLRLGAWLSVLLAVDAVLNAFARSRNKG